MKSFVEMLLQPNWTGSAEQIQEVEQFARDYPWEQKIADPEYAADVVVSDLKDVSVIELHRDAESVLRARFGSSAEKVRL